MERSSLSGGTLRLRIGDITVAMAGGGPGLKLGVEASAERFLVENGEPDVTIRAAWGELREPATGDRIFDSGGVWQLYRQNADHLFHFRSPVFGKLPYKTARFNGDFTSGEVFLNSGCFQANGPIYPLEYPLDEVLMMHLLADGRGAEVHASGAVDSDGRGLLFLGQSGAGKTTMSRLLVKAGGARILSDDRIILRRLDGQIWIYGTPWHGEGSFASAARAPLRQIFFLGRGPSNELIPLRAGAAVARLMACSFVPFYSPGGLDFTLAFFQQVAQAVPCNEIRFVPDSRVVEFLQRKAC